MQRYSDINAIRLFRYSKLIDKAILAQRYSLATHLAYRCLLEYHRLFIRFMMHQARHVKRNAFQLSIVVVRHLRKRQKLTVRRTHQLFGMLRSAYALTYLVTHRHGDRDLHTDRVTAMFARDQALAMANFLFGTLRETQDRA